MSAGTRQRMGELIFGFMPTQLVHVMARLSLAEHITGGARTSAGLAAATGVAPLTVHRLVRGLANLGLVAQDQQGEITLTDLGALLRADARGSLRDVALHFGGEGFVGWTHLSEAVVSGEVAFEAGTGTGFFRYLEEHPAAGTAFNATMAQLSRGVVAQAVPAYDFASATRILDIGGGTGHFLAEILTANPQARGTVFDLPHVCEEARRYLDGAGVGVRCGCAPGSFFDTVPDGHDLHVLKTILHDWDDADCGRILAASRAAIAPNGRLLVVERLVPEVVTPGPVLDPVIASDLQMLVYFGAARERTLAEYEALLTAAGFTAPKMLALSIGFSMLISEAG